MAQNLPQSRFPSMKHLEDELGKIAVSLPGAAPVPLPIVMHKEEEEDDEMRGDDEFRVPNVPAGSTLEGHADTGEEHEESPPAESSEFIGALGEVDDPTAPPEDSDEAMTERSDRQE